ncbi:hypothetical protein RJ639_041236 [Escallonia herrerae]|uniref:RNase H type-1 domain-containing protein n=1 Tax=Escallonia herrerae TaxID=1293975 RepID=A0AA88WFR1_9ASTE|nr:hypothetical protein RJ639_041236 [Escallonia herrerae]
MPADKKDAQLYCHFHKDHGHMTEEYKVLQCEIENLIAKGHLKQFVKANERQGGRRGGSQRRHGESVPKEPPVINTISGGLSAGGTLKLAQKAYVRQVNLTQGPAKRPRAPTTISFNDTDLEEVITPHDDALVISLQIDAYVIKRILVDTGSSADILFEEAFFQMQISRDRIRSVSSPLYGFTGASTPVEGINPLTVVAGKYPLQATQSIDFLVVKTLHVDGSSNASGSGAGLILHGPENLVVEYALRFDFPASNNEAEYEALIVGMHLAKAMQAEALHAHSNSQLLEHNAEEKLVSRFIVDPKPNVVEEIQTPLRRSDSLYIQDLFLYVSKPQILQDKGISLDIE